MNQKSMLVMLTAQIAYEVGGRQHGFCDVFSGGGTYSVEVETVTEHELPGTQWLDPLRDDGTPDGESALCNKQMLAPMHRRDMNMRTETV